MEYGIEHDIPGLERKVWAINFRSVDAARIYIAERIDLSMNPVIKTRLSEPAYSARNVVGLTEWRTL